MDDTSFSLRRNAKRAAERAIDAGTAPSIDYHLHTRADGRFEIVWKTGRESPTTAEIEEEITTAIAEADEPIATETPADAPPEPKPLKKEPRPASPPNRQPSRSAELDAAAAQGIMPEKPLVTSKANPHYQKRFDHLADLAARGEWDAVQAYEVKGINSYAKMVRQYRDRLLAAHAAQSTEVGP